MQYAFYFTYTQLLSDILPSPLPVVLPAFTESTVESCSGVLHTRRLFAMALLKNGLMAPIMDALSRAFLCGTKSVHSLLNRVVHQVYI